ncbi:MAG: hypothetical protein OXE99_11260 [Cellvibrionales bacterium]|nr:hypothetical protein [Cellvibrionales bacterium]
MRTCKVTIIALLLGLTVNVFARNLPNAQSQKSFWGSTGFMVGISVVLGVGLGVVGHEAYKHYRKQPENANAPEVPQKPQVAASKFRKLRGGRQSLGTVISGSAQ